MDFRHSITVWFKNTKAWVSNKFGFQTFTASEILNCLKIQNMYKFGFQTQFDQTCVKTKLFGN